MKRLPENPEYAELRHDDVILTSQCRHIWTCGQRTTVHFLSFQRVGMGNYVSYNYWYMYKQRKSRSGVREISFSYSLVVLK